MLEAVAHSTEKLCRSCSPRWLGGDGSRTRTNSDARTKSCVIALEYVVSAPSDSLVVLGTGTGT